MRIAELLLGRDYVPVVLFHADILVAGVPSGNYSNGSSTDSAPIPSPAVSTESGGSMSIVRSGLEFVFRSSPNRLNTGYYYGHVFRIR